MYAHRNPAVHLVLSLLAEELLRLNRTDQLQSYAMDNPALRRIAASVVVTLVMVVLVTVVVVPVIVFVVDVAVVNVEVVNVDLGSARSSSLAFFAKSLPYLIIWKH